MKRMEERRQNNKEGRRIAANSNNEGATCSSIAEKIAKSFSHAITLIEEVEQRKLGVKYIRDKKGYLDNLIVEIPCVELEDLDGIYLEHDEALVLANIMEKEILKKERNIKENFKFLKENGFDFDVIESTFRKDLPCEDWDSIKKYSSM